MRSLVLVVAILILLGASACGGGDDTTEESTGAADTGAFLEPETEPPAAETAAAAATAAAFQIKVPSSAPIGPTSPPKVIKQLQTALAMLGYKVGEPDGVYGDKTRKAVIAFQKKQKLEADGLVGAKTARAINKALRQQAENP